MPSTFSIVTPSFNQAGYIQETLESVLSQEGDFSIEYVVMDGGSTDGTVEILERVENEIGRGERPMRCHGIRFSWVSEKDNGQYNAINKGFNDASGDFMAWINSDDRFTPGAFQRVNDVFSQLPEVHWLSSLLPSFMDSAGKPLPSQRVPGFSREAFLDGRYLHGRKKKAHELYFIQQESTFWRRSLWEQVGSVLREEFGLAADFDLWCRFYEFAELVGLNGEIGVFRSHDIQRSRIQFDEYLREARAALGELRAHVGHSRTRPPHAWRYAFQEAGPVEKLFSLAGWPWRYEGLQVNQEVRGAHLSIVKFR